MEDDKRASAKVEEGETQDVEENGQVPQPERSISSEFDLPSEQSSRRPFTSLSQEDSDMALARALQEQERAYMLLQMNAESSDHETSESGSYEHEDYINDGGENEELDAIADELEAHALVDDPNEEIDPSLFDSDEAYARALQDAEDREMTARMMALANQWEEDDNEDNDGSSQDDRWQDVDPDNMLYEELVALGEVVGTESKGLEQDAISSLPLSKYVQQSPSSSNCEQLIQSSQAKIYAVSDILELIMQCFFDVWAVSDISLMVCAPLLKMPSLICINEILAPTVAIATYYALS